MSRRERQWRGVREGSRVASERRLPKGTPRILHSEPALGLLQRADKQEEQAQKDQDEVDDLALEVFLAEQEGSAQE